MKILCSRKVQSKSKVDVYSLPLGSIVTLIDRLHYYRYVKVHVSVDGRISNKKDWFLAINDANEYVDQNNMTSGVVHYNSPTSLQRIADDMYTVDVVDSGYDNSYWVNKFDKLRTGL